MYWLNYLRAIRARISQDNDAVMLCFELEGHAKVIWHFSIPKGVRHSSERVMLVKKIVKPREASGVLQR